MRGFKVIIAPTMQYEEFDFSAEDWPNGVSLDAIHDSIHDNKMLDWRYTNLHELKAWMREVNKEVKNESGSS